ncbi:MAG: putative YcjX-like family ATPase [Paraglaciecola sp.]|jgi:predicted YcjX-like family ATPase
MNNKIEQHPYFLKAKQSLKLAGARLADRHVSLAVTGLSGSGKTAFITSLVNQLLEANDGAQLPFFSVLRESRLKGVRREAQPDLNITRFAYEDAMAALHQTPAQWPSSTKGISQVRLRLRFRKQSGISRYVTEDATLTLDITDYPGEWLLDLPLLEMDYSAWAQHCDKELNDPARATLAEEFKRQVSVLDLNAKGDELILQKIAQHYTNYLLACQNKGYQLLQPGRFILPGELVGAPVLHFFPLSKQQLQEQNIDLNQPVKDSYAQLLVERFEHYKKHVVSPFYQQHFKRFDRQVVLVDCLSALNRGHSSYTDLQKALDWLMGSFEYGSSNLLQRLFKPKIDKLMFAASKADHITPDQQSNLVKLLDSMLHSARKQIQFDGVLTESTAIAAIRASQAGISEHQGESLQVLKGVDRAGQSLTLFPGEVPQSCPDDSFWQRQSFAFPEFAPAPSQGKHALEHIRMDQVLDFLLADKML